LFGLDIRETSVILGLMEENETDIFELEARLLYSVVVAGKNAKFANAVTRRWLAGNIQDGETPFDAIRRLVLEDSLEESFREARTGNYGKVTAAAKGMADSELDLTTCAPQDLEQIKGIGPKTSRFFLMWTRPGECYAALDVHILRWLQKQGYDAPKNTPQSKTRYAELEKAFIEEAEKRGKTPRELDLEIWIAGSKDANRVEREAEEVVARPQDKPMS